MDYYCGNFGDCSFSRFGCVVQTDRQTDADERFTPATLMKHDVNVDFGSKSAS